MADASAPLEVLFAPKGLLFWFATAAAAVAMSVLFLLNTRNRDAVTDALMAAPNGSPIEVPERRWTYDTDYLDKFVAVASTHMTAFGDSALQRYLRPTLIWNDAAFAVMLTTFTVLAAFGIAPYLPWPPYSRYLMLVVACSGIIYGVADVVEDWKLLTILDRGVPVDPSDAALANALTRIKLAAISLSGIGGVAFVLLTMTSRLLRRSAVRRGA